MLQNKTLRNERMGSSRIKQNRGRYCVDRERTEHDVWGILRFFPGHMVQVTLPVVVVGIEIVALGGWIVPTIVRLGCRVSRLRALFSIMPLLTTSIAGDPWTVCELLIPGMKLSDGPWLSSRGSPCFCPWNLSLASVVASKSRLVPLSLTDIFQTTALILQGNGLVHQSFKIRKGVYNQLAS